MRWFFLFVVVGVFWGVFFWGGGLGGVLLPRMLLMPWQTLCQKVNDGSASVMRKHHLFSNTNYTADSS